MAEIVNLRQVRKRGTRADKEARAQENRVTHGLTKAERLRAKDEKACAKGRLDGKQIEREP